ncbi:transcription factor BTF3 homolog 4-like [Dendronephthya gigantea]|uniref:transcription factor BTF3 homolog 4-like n=1 Tax=Dendronephthya gigantea TaxID=151771 RepID=UPI0010696067|nr:transcription factor BTF3 homolog 4-like [Dendronephthya gigantea]
MNPDKLNKLQNQVRIGGKGTPRRKKKVVHKTATTDDKRLQNSLKKLAVNTIPGIEEVNMIKDDGNVIHFLNPKVQASLQANTFAIQGHAETKPLSDLLPGIYNQLDLTNLPTKMPVVPSSDISALDDADDEVPDLVENFDEPSKNETV